MFNYLTQHNKLKLTGILITGSLLIFFTQGFTQHRGDNLAFQGISDVSNFDVKAMAMGNAFTSMAGGLSSLYFNPAGLVSVNSFEISISANKYVKQWQENQEYRPNRLFVTMPFYLEGLYNPDPANVDPMTGEPLWDDELAIDTSYSVQLPDLGLDSFSEEAADWIKKKNSFTINTIALAYPFSLFDKHIVVSAGYKNQYNVLDFDRNDTYLDPHIGYTKYDMPERTTGLDTIKVHWYRFLRERFGNLHEAKLAFGLDLNKRIKLGLGLNILNGETEDVQYLNKYGYFEFAEQNRFRFGFDTLDTKISGTSNFNSFAFNLGGIYNFDNFSVGINIIFPHTLERKWEYEQLVVDTLGSNSETINGTDKFEKPAIYNFGFNLSPINNFIFSFDYCFANYSKSNFEFAEIETDTTHNHWVDQHIIRFGIEYQPVSFLSLMAGYQYLPQTFVPDGAAFRDRGPAAISYTFGASLKLFSLGRIDIAYEIHRFKYYDQYFSNTNYNLIKLDNFSLGYVYRF